MITVCLSIYRKEGFQSVRKIFSYSSISEMQKDVEYISKYPNVERVEVDYAKQQNKKSNKYRQRYF